MTSRNKVVSKSIRKRVYSSSCNTTIGTLSESYRSLDQLTSGNSPSIDGRIVLRNNSLSRRKYLAEDSMVATWIDHPICPYTFYHNSVYPNDYSFTNLLGSDASDVSDMAISKWYSSLNSLKLNTAEFFATRQQTVDLIATNVRRIGGMYSSLRRGRNPFNGSNCNGRHASKIWLENVYGWQPLLSDIYSVMNDQISDPPPFRHKVAVYKSYPAVGETLKKVIPTPGLTLNTTWKIHPYYRTTIQADIKVKDPSVAFAQTMGLTNPMLLAWELLPYSFVVDWFLPIGPWLEAQQALLGLSVSNPAVTKTTFYYAEGATISSGISPYKMNGTGQSRLVERRKTRSLTLPSLPLPKLKNPVSVGHTLNAIALLGVQFGRQR